MAANTPVLLRAAMVDGRADLGLMSSGQIAGLIDDLPGCQELIEAITAEAVGRLDRLARSGRLEPGSFGMIRPNSPGASHLQSVQVLCGLSRGFGVPGSAAA